MAAPAEAGAGPTEDGPGYAEAVAPAEPEPDAGGEEQRGRGRRVLGIAAVALGILVLAGVALGALAAVTHDFRPKTVVTYRPAAVFGLRPGDCLNSGPNGLAVTLVPCATSHDAEVFATFSLQGTSWPGDAAVRHAAGDGCQSRLAGYLNPQLAGAGLAQEFVFPDRVAWRAGERTVVCEVSASSGQLTGSVRAPG